MIRSPADPTGSTVVLAVSDVLASVEHYVNVFGFAKDFVYGDPPFYAGVTRGQVAIHLQGPDATTRPAGTGSLYLFVGDAMAAHAELASRGANVTVPPAPRDYGLVDFSVVDLDGNQLVWASDVDPGSSGAG